MPARRISLAAIAALATATACAAESAAPLFTCRGNEPSWRVDIGPDQAALARLGEPAGETYRGALTRFEFLQPEWIVWRGASGAKPERTLVVTLRKETCRDTMSDETPFPYRAAVSFPDGTAAHGCCRG